MIKTEDKKYFLCRNKQPYLVKTIQEMDLLYDPWDLNNVIYILKELDYPFIMKDYMLIFKNKLSQSKNNYCSFSKILSRYISQMNLCSYRGFAYKDSNLFNMLEE